VPSVYSGYSMDPSAVGECFVNCTGTETRSAGGGNTTMMGGGQTASSGESGPSASTSAGAGAGGSTGYAVRGVGSSWGMSFLAVGLLGGGLLVLL
jgi:hypothetical protein